MSVRSIIKKYFPNYYKSELKCKSCGSNDEVEFYEICEKETDKILLSGNFCPTCIVAIAIKSREATFHFENEDVNFKNGILTK